MTEPNLDQQAWDNRRSSLDVVEEALPAGFALHKGGSGNRHFLDRIDRNEGVWREGKAAARLLFRVEFTEETVRLAYIPEQDPFAMPGGIKTDKGASRVIALAFMPVVLFQTDDGFTWPAGWQWTLLLLLSEPLAKTNSSVKAREVDLVRGTLSADRQALSILNWAVIGHLPPPTEYRSEVVDRVFTYGQMTSALEQLLSEGPQTMELLL